MKKLMYVIFTLVLVLLLAACNNNDNNEGAVATTTTASDTLTEDVMTEDVQYEDILTENKLASSVKQENEFGMNSFYEVYYYKDIQDSYEVGEYYLAPIRVWKNKIVNGSTITASVATDWTLGIVVKSYENPHTYGYKLRIIDMWTEENKTYIQVVMYTKRNASRELVDMSINQSAVLKNGEAKIFRFETEKFKIRQVSKPINNSVVYDEC